MDKIKVQLRETTTTTKKFELDSEGQLKKVRTNKNDPQYAIILSEIRDKVMELYTAHLIIPFDQLDSFINHIDNMVNGYEDHFYAPDSWTILSEAVNIYMNTDCYTIEIIDVHYPTTHENYRREINIPHYEMKGIIYQINAYVKAVENMEEE